VIKWSILIATVPPRAKKLERLLKILMPQVDKYKGQIEVVVLFNNFDFPSLGNLRQHLLDDAKGEYINYIDDDDIIPKDYCDTIFPLLDGVDYVGFNVELRNEGMSLRPVFHSLKYSHWHDDESGYYRGITHLNPIKVELARIGKFPEQDVGEDHYWTMQIQQYINDNSLKREFTEHYINRDMYIYDHFGHEHMSSGSIAFPQRPRLKSKNIRFHPLSTKTVKEPRVKNN